MREVDPRTMASKLMSGLYFCGEVLDAAFATGHAAGTAAAESATAVIE